LVFLEVKPNKELNSKTIVLVAVEIVLIPMLRENDLKEYKSVLENTFFNPKNKLNE
jgi:hypothetical protein